MILDRRRRVLHRLHPRRPELTRCRRVIADRTYTRDLTLGEECEACRDLLRIERRELRLYSRLLP
jgi:hypothetical protein